VSTKREPSTPPAIPGLHPVRLLGMGGFADVFCYEQQMPRRLVAVKVLLASSLGEDVREAFRAEANVMASLSHHPSIVTVFGADVAADGRPYLVMEYCSRPGLGQRYRTERMSVAEVLRIGVRLASAVETAHRAGILHRDIKPANVLVTDFGWPALTDFGIAATTAGTAVGMSIPWSPPELLAEEPRSDERSDVYSLAATIYSLLAGRSPFEIPGGPNSAADLVARIERAPLPPIGRVDVPASLEAVLARGMERDPARRYHSAVALARALQQVEAELNLPLTPLDLPDEAPEPEGYADPSAESGQATRLRPVTAVAPDGPPRGATPPAGVPMSPAWGDLPPLPSAAAPDAGPDGIPEAWREQAAAVGAVPEEAPAPRRRLAGAVAGVVVVGAAAAVGVLALREPPAEPEPTTAATAPTVVRAVPSPVNLRGVVIGDEAEFAWENPDPMPGDSYVWTRLEVGGSAPSELVDEPRVRVPAGAGDVCIEVSIRREDGRLSGTPASGCADR
jgi:serine/threonine protein kinase